MPLFSGSSQTNGLDALRGDSILTSLPESLRPRRSGSARPKADRDMNGKGTARSSSDNGGGLRTSVEDSQAKYSSAAPPKTSGTKRGGSGDAAEPPIVPRSRTTSPTKRPAHAPNSASHAAPPHTVTLTTATATAATAPAPFPASPPAPLYQPASGGALPLPASVPPAAAPLPPALTSRQFNKLRAMTTRPEDFDLAAPLDEGNRLRLEATERLTDLLGAPLHLRAVFRDPAALLRFTAFLAAHRPQSLAALVYYLDASKALRAIEYANAVARALEHVPEPDPETTAPLPSDEKEEAMQEGGGEKQTNGEAPQSRKPLAPIAQVTANAELRAQADRAFARLVKQDLPAYTAYLFTQVIKARTIVPLNRAPKQEETFSGFAEVFCLTDPRRTDNPIIFASPAFHQMTQYAMHYIIGRNCRFLQGPHTNRDAPARIRHALAANVPHWEVFVNYRRDGAPFLNLLMCAPLFDEWGAVRYHLGAQIDVSDVLADGSAPELEALRRALARADRHCPPDPTPADLERAEKAWRDDDAFQGLVEMLDMQELQAIRAWEERLVRAAGPGEAAAEQLPPASRDSGVGSVSKNGSGSERSRDKDDDEAATWAREKRPGLPVRPPQPAVPIRGMHYGLYDKFLLVRPAPSLRILFASPSLASQAGLIQSRVLDQLAVSGRVRFELTQALEEGREVTAKVGWRERPDEAARPRWIVFTPLVGRRGAVGVWMVILEDHIPEAAARRPNVAPNRAAAGRPAQYAGARPGTRGEEELQPQPGSIPEDVAAEGEYDDVLPAATAPLSPGSAAAPMAVPPRGASQRHAAKLSWSGADGAPDRRNPTLNWLEQRDRAAVYGLGEADGWEGAGGRGEYVSLEERLRKKREREGLMMGSSPLDGPGAGLLPVRRTYKSLSPDTFINIAD